MSRSVIDFIYGDDFYEAADYSFDFHDCVAASATADDDEIKVTTTMLTILFMMMKILKKMMLMQPMWKEMGETLPSLITCRGGGGRLSQSSSSWQG